MEIKTYKKTLKYHWGFNNNLNEFLLNGQSNNGDDDSSPNYSKYKLRIIIGIIAIFDIFAKRSQISFIILRLPNFN